MTGEKRQKLFLHSSLSIQYTENYIIQFKEGTHKKLLNSKNVAYDESFLTINMKCLHNARLSCTFLSLSSMFRGWFGQRHLYYAITYTLRKGNLCMYWNYIFAVKLLRNGGLVL